MRNLITILLFCFALQLNAQQPMFWGMNPKGSLMIYQKDSKTGTSATSHSLTGVPAGALLVVTTASETDGRGCTVSSSPSLTWTKRADAQGTSSGDAEIWTAVYTAGGSITVGSDWLPATQSSTVYVVVNQESTLGGTSGTATGQGAPNKEIITTKTGSILFCVTSDWNAIDGSGREYRAGCEEQYYTYTGGAFASYHYILRAKNLAAYKLGLSFPSTMSGGTAIYEVRPK